MKYLSILLVIAMIGVIACSSSEKVLNDTLEEAKENFENGNANLSSSFSLDNYRTQLSDAYAYRENKIPEAFNRVKVEEEVERDLYEGYRIQIYSGESVVAADTVAANFRVWADSTITGYQPDTYTFFRTPYYRVHIGDFHERDRAIMFSNIVKRYFKDAWVVYDKVNPSSVPADTAVIQTK